MTSQVWTTIGKNKIDDSDFMALDFIPHDLLVAMMEAYGFSEEFQIVLLSWVNFSR